MKFQLVGTGAVALAAVVVGIASGSAARPSAPAGATLTPAKKQQALDAYGKMPLAFTANAGQADARVRYIRQPANIFMNFACYLRSSRTARTDGPDWLISQDDTGKGLGCQASEPFVELSLNDLLSLISFSFSQRFTDANNGRKIRTESGPYFLIDCVVGFSKKLSPFGMAHQTVEATDVRQHLGRNFTGVCAFGLPKQILGRNRYITSLSCLDYLCQNREGGGDNNVTMIRIPNQRGKLLHELNGFPRRLIHLPVACNDRSAQGNPLNAKTRKKSLYKLDKGFALDIPGSASYCTAGCDKKSGARSQNG